MQKITFLLAFILTGLFSKIVAQTAIPLFYKGAIKANKTALQRNIIQNTITRNLSLPLNIDTEENWADAFWGIQLLKYQSPWTDGRIKLAFDSIEYRSVFFQKALLDLVSSNYPGKFAKPVSVLLNKTADIKTYALCAEYLLRSGIELAPELKEEKRILQLVKKEQDAAIARQLLYRIKNFRQPRPELPIDVITDGDFLKGVPVVISFQRKNRDYPGLAIVRNAGGHFVKDENGNYFSVPQLARSISNMPGYLTNGNTPQGILRMHGFDTSKTTFIGPTTNIQLTLPFETSLKHFFRDSTIIDSSWTEEWYGKLLPKKLKTSEAMYEAYYAGKAGRTEIIAHGTTVDPEYYKDAVYYPQTPTLGCLCTIERWSESTGERLESDQAKLVAALQVAGGPDGYYVVIELNDEQRPVSIEEILPWIKNK